jgi:hypothetical protein
MTSVRARLAAVIMVAVVCMPVVASSGGRDRQWTAFANVSPFAAFDYVADGHGPSSKGIIELGLGGRVVMHAGRFEFGLGLQYDTGDGDHRLHFIAAPVRAGLAVIRRSRHCLSLQIEAGPAIGLAPSYGPLSADGSSVGVLWTLGVSAALGLGYGFATSASHAVVVEVGIRIDRLPEVNADVNWYLHNGALTNIQLPFVRVGVTWN